MRTTMKKIVMPLLAGALVAIVPLLASAKLDGRCFGDGGAIALKAVSSDAGSSKAPQAETQEQHSEDAPLDALENMLSEPSEDDVPEQLVEAESAAAQEVESMTEPVQAAEPSMEQAAPQTVTAELQTEPVQVQAQELAAEPEPAPAAEPEPAPAPAPAPTPAYGAIPFELAAQTGTWWGIDSSDSAYWAVQENINAMRAAGGLPALSVDGGLSAIASARCQSFVEGGPFDHSGMITTSEICAAGPLGSASAVCAAWQNSPDHYANIMEPSFSSMGIGCLFCSFEGNNYTYWVVTFQ